MHATTRHTQPAGVTNGHAGAQRHPSAWRLAPHPNATTQRRSSLPAPPRLPPHFVKEDGHGVRRRLVGGPPLSTPPACNAPSPHPTATTSSLTSPWQRRVRVGRAASNSAASSPTWGAAGGAAAKRVADQRPPRGMGEGIRPKTTSWEAGGRVGTEGGEGEGGALHERPNDPLAEESEGRVGAWHDINECRPPSPATFSPRHGLMVRRQTPSPATPRAHVQGTSI